MIWSLASASLGPEQDGERGSEDLEGQSEGVPHTRRSSSRPPLSSNSGSGVLGQGVRAGGGRVPAVIFQNKMMATARQQLKLIWEGNVGRPAGFINQPRDTQGGGGAVASGPVMSAAGGTGVESAADSPLRGCGGREN